MPFCPQCRSEFNEDVSICTDCQVELIPKLPLEGTIEYVNRAIVQSVSSEVVGNILKGVLEDRGIEAVLRSHDMPSVGGVQGDFSPYWGDILVHPDDLESARDILESYLASLPSNVAEDPDVESDTV